MLVHHDLFYKKHMRRLYEHGVFSERWMRLGFPSMDCKLKSREHGLIEVDSELELRKLFVCFCLFSEPVRSSNVFSRPEKQVVQSAKEHYAIKPLLAECTARA